MFSKIVLCATNNKLIAGQWQFGRLKSYQIFQHTLDGLEDFGRFLQQNVGVNIYLLADTVEEDYRLETMPHTTGAARREMVNRKLNQLYRNSPYRTAHFINREVDKRKDDRFLFVALTQAEFLQPWINQIQAYQAPLVGVYLLPMVSQHFVRRMKVMSSHSLLSERLSSGLRQTYLHNGRLRISRLSPFALDTEKSLAHFYAVEAEKTKLYLISQRFIGRDTELKMLIPAYQEHSQSLCHDVEQEHGIACSTIDLAKFASGLKLQLELLRDHPELLHMHLLANGTVPDNLAPSTLGKYHQINLIRQVINVSALAVLSLGLALSSLYLKQTFDNKNLMDQTALATKHQEQLYQEVAKDFPETPLPVDVLQLLAELDKAIIANAKLPSHAIQMMADAITASPEIEINRLNWLLSNDEDPKDQDSAALSGINTEKRSTAVTFVPDKNLLHEVIFLNGEIPRFTGNYRTALESVNRLVERLRAEERVAQVMVLQTPVNVSSYSNLQGSTSDERTALSTPALFKLRVILKREELVQ
jgi:hypothetical protein